MHVAFSLGGCPAASRRRRSEFRPKWLTSSLSPGGGECAPMALGMPGFAWCSAARPSVQFLGGSPASSPRPGRSRCSRRSSCGRAWAIRAGHPGPERFATDGFQVLRRGLPLARISGMSRSLDAPLMVVGALLGIGCTSPCVQLAEKICGCQPTQRDRSACNSQQSSRSDQVNPTAAEEQACAELIDKCDCHLLDTPQGKIDCGLARQ